MNFPPEESSSTYEDLALEKRSSESQDRLLRLSGTPFRKERSYHTSLKSLGLIQFCLIIFYTLISTIIVLTLHDTHQTPSQHHNIIYCKSIYYSNISHTHAIKLIETVRSHKSSHPLQIKGL